MPLLYIHGSPWLSEVPEVEQQTVKVVMMDNYWRKIVLMKKKLDYLI
jgi:hypothetical protein